MKNRLPPKHLRSLDPASLAALRTGFSRFRFGFASPGEILTSRHNGNRFEFIGNFSRMKDANAAAATHGAKVNPYLFGRLARGWSVYRIEQQLKAA